MPDPTPQRDLVTIEELEGTYDVQLCDLAAFVGRLIATVEAALGRVAELDKCPACIGGWLCSYMSPECSEPCQEYNGTGRVHRDRRSALASLQLTPVPKPDEGSQG